MKSNKGAVAFLGKKMLPILGLLLISGAVFAVGGGGSETIGDVAASVTGTFDNIAKLITAAAYVVGFALVMVGIMKLKAHKDNPQIPISTGIALIFLGAALIFLPSIFSVTGSTLFGSSGVKGSVSGVSSF